MIHVGTSAIISGFHPEGVLTRDVSTAKKYKGRPSNGFWNLGKHASNHQ